MTQFHFNFDPNSFSPFKTSRKPKMKPAKAHLTAGIITPLLALAIDYVTLSAWNLHSPSTVMLVVFLLIVLGISDFVLSGKAALIQKLCAFAAGFLFIAMLLLMFLGASRSTPANTAIRSTSKTFRISARSFRRFRPIGSRSSISRPRRC